MFLQTKVPDLIQPPSELALSDALNSEEEPDPKVKIPVDNEVH